MRSTEEKADKQTITNATDASQIQKSNPKKQYEQAIDGNAAGCRKNRIKIDSGKVGPMSIQFMCS